MKYIKTLLIVAISFQLVSCGTMIYPERRNQAAGRIDVGVALLDGFWLLVGIIPGVIAFAVDFSTGAIYLPATRHSRLDSRDMRVVEFDPETTTQKEIEEMIRKETGQDFRFSDERLEITRVRTPKDISVRFAQFQHPNS